MSIDWTKPVTGTKGRSKGIATVFSLGDCRWGWRVAYKKHTGSGEAGSEPAAREAAEKRLDVLMRMVKR